MLCVSRSFLNLLKMIGVLDVLKRTWAISVLSLKDYGLMFTTWGLFNLCQNLGPDISFASIRITTTVDGSNLHAWTRQKNASATALGFWSESCLRFCSQQ